MLFRSVRERFATQLPVRHAFEFLTREGEGLPAFVHLSMTSIVMMNKGSWERVLGTPFLQQSLCLLQGLLVGSTFLIENTVKLPHEQGRGPVGHRPQGGNYRIDSLSQKSPGKTHVAFAGNGFAKPRAAGTDDDQVGTEPLG